MPANRSSSRRMFQFTFNVPFPTSVEAEIAREYLLLNIHRQGPAHLEQSVNDKVLTVRLTAEDPEQLRLAIISCLDQLAMAVRTMQRLVSRFSTKSRLEREG
ncbi:EKC/KEOPS complex subunit LAGE3-like [Echinops telfairi]|uniref:EKC/KEOPS complex subunit LAGE3-like n=1 Tax=Echinops telfairi TaxID=9371 RepID=A0ABM0J977_ECHTE|nr:EKC/KEOPS complex subunit LAGE3-like [Echinops telfairi]